MRRTVRVCTIWSQRTHALFVDEDRTVPVFTNLEDAVSYTVRRPDGKYLRVAELKDMYLKELYTKSYAAGAITVIVNPGLPSQADPHTISENMVRKDFYNPRLNLVMQNFLHTKKAGCLKEFASCEYLFAVKVQDNKIIYATLVNPKDKEQYLYLAFRDLPQFTHWNMTGMDDTGGWSPIKVDYGGAGIISGDHGIMIDPQGARFVITPHLKSIISKEAQNS